MEVEVKEEVTQKELTKYTKEEVLESAKEYFKGDVLAAEVWTNKYALKDTAGNLYEKSPDDMHRRLAREFARIEDNFPNPLKEQEIYDLLKDFKYLVPQGSPMSGIGNDFQYVSLSNCFVIGNEVDSDSYGGIMKLDQELVQLMKRRAGVGVDLSFVRPSNSPVMNSALTSTGVVPFMERFSNSTREVAQGGRRGALMESIAIDHPDSEAFIDAKTEAGKVTGANVSVKISDDFMNAALSGEDYTLTYPVRSENPTHTKVVDAKRIWDKVIHNAWKSAEPGILFWDTLINDSIPDCYADLGFKTVSTNPCLVGDTLIKTTNGELPIKTVVERFKNGEDFEVYTYNEKTKEIEVNDVHNAMLSKENANIIELVMEDDSTISLTPDHKVFTEERGWIEASQLTVDDTLIGIDDRQNKLKLINTKIKKINVKTNEDVYDLTVENNHNFFANGLLVHNCGEIPLCPNDSCRLLAINLYSYVNNPFTKEASFDYELFKNHVTIAQRLMDDLIELELEKIDKIIAKIKSDPESDVIKSTELNLWYNIKEKCEQGRRTGLGITAEGDMLAALGITYGTKESNDFTEDLHMQLKHSAYRSSNIMAQERGTFGIWDPEREKDNPFLLRIQKEDPELYKDLVKYGRRNIALLTIAPTGSVSIMTQTTSGIEPVFMIYYTRRKKVNADDGDVRVDFTDEVGDTWQEFPVFHHKFLTYLEANGYNIDDVMNLPPNEIDKIVAKSPYHKATANDVDWVEKVEMQGKIQKHIDHSISVTVNLPNDISEEIVAKVYETGWKSGCKGITVYRDGSRSGVLISNDDKKEEKVNKITKTTAPTRDKSLKCDIHHVTANKQKWVVIIGLLEGDPYEVFAFKPKFVHLPKSVTEGNLVRIKRGHYNLECSNGLIIENIADNFETDEQEALTRIISAALRHGTDAQFIFEQLNKSEGTITSFSKAVGRTLKKYLKDGEKGSGDCDECGAKDSLVYQEGCLSCKECGWSKC